MKKIFILFILSIAFISNADTTIVNTSGLTITPSNVVALELFDGVTDTIADSTKVTFGPYRLVADRNQKMYDGFQFFSAAMGGITPTAALAYQLSFSSDTGDIIANNWVTSDTLGATGTTAYISLDSMAAPYIYIRIHNYNATADVMGYFGLEFKKAD